MSCGVVRRHGSDPELLWLWHRLAAVAVIRPLVWEPPHAAGAALKRQGEKKKATYFQKLEGEGCGREDPPCSGEKG